MNLLERRIANILRYMKLSKRIPFVYYVFCFVLLLFFFFGMFCFVVRSFFLYYLEHLGLDLVHQAWRHLLMQEELPMQSSVL